jgi:hypothetical protein
MLWKIKRYFCKTCSSQAFHMIPQQSKKTIRFLSKRQKALSPTAALVAGHDCLW